MPELVEAEVCATQLNVALWRATVTECRGELLSLVGWTVTSVTRVGNAILMEFSNPGAGDRYLLSRFGASGRWSLRPESKARLCLTLSTPMGAVTAAFVEGRKSGGATLEAAERPTDFIYVKNAATTFDVMSDRFDDHWLINVFSRVGLMRLHRALTRPEYFPGIGPWIANEAMFRARLNPQLPAISLELRRCGELIRGICLVVSNSVVRRGAALGAWRNPDGSRGTAEDDFCVHSRDGLACYICDDKIKKDGTVYWCPTCQPGI